MQSLQILNNYNAHACILRRHDPWLLVCTKQYYYLHTPADLAFACGLDDRNKLPGAALPYTVLIITCSHLVYLWVHGKCMSKLE